MLDTLIHYAQSWSIDRANLFHNNVRRDDREGKYIWEHRPDGILLYRDLGAYHIGFNGIIHKLTSQFTLHDWEDHCELYKIASSRNIRIDVPIEQKIVELNGVNYSYEIIHRPGQQLGNDFYKDILLKKVDTKYFLYYVDQATSILECTNLVAEKKNKLYPSCRFTLMHRAEDSVGHFWYDIKKWFMPKTPFLLNSLTDLERIVDYLNYNKFSLDKDAILTKATEQWNLALF